MKTMRKNEKGESLVTVMMATAVAVGVLSLIVPAVINLSTPNTASESNKDCRAIADNILHKLKSNGSQTKIYNPPIDESSVFLDDHVWHNGGNAFNTQNVVSEVGAAEDKRWPHVKVISWNPRDNIYESNSPLLIQSSMNGLLSLYNKNRALCSSDHGVDISSQQYLLDLIPDQNKFANVKAYLKITPFDTNSNALINNCPTNLKIRPPAFVEPAPAVAAGMITFPGYTHNRGFEVSVKVDLESHSQNVSSRRQNGDTIAANLKSSCTLKSRFQYDQAEVLPPSPEATFNGDNYTFRKPVGYNTPGTHLLCQEEHFYYYYVTRRGFLGTTRRVRRQRPTVTTDWKVCDQITVCGETASRRQLNQADGEIRLTYPSLSPNCRSSMTVKLFDAQGNTSDTLPLPRASIPVCTGICGTPTPPTTRERRPSSTTGYSVGGVQFDTRADANAAAAISGLSIREISDPTNPQDSVMGSVSSSLNTLNSMATNAQNLADTANALSGGATLTAGELASNETAAAQHANDAAAVAAAAQAAYDSLASNLNVMSFDGTSVVANRLGPVGEAALEQAAQQLQAAKDAAEQAVIGDRSAAVAARQAGVAAAQASVASASASLSSCQANVTRECRDRTRPDGSTRRSCRTIYPDCSSQQASLAAAQASLASAQAALAAAQAAKTAAENSYRSNWNGV